LMSGNQKRLIKIQVTMAAVMVALCIGLVPWLGILGASVAAAITNVGINLWNLLQVKKLLGLLPYNRSYLKLLPPTAAAVAMILLLKRNQEFFRHDWLTVGVCTAAAYLVFAVIVLMFGLDSDDRLIANAIWSRLRGMVGRTPVGVTS
jgi:O-antigen/teichoic acid export membrane protein